MTYYDAGEELSATVEEWADYIQAETLSLELVPGPVPDDVAQQGAFELDGHPLTLGVRQV